MPIIYLALRAEGSLPATLEARLERALPFVPDVTRTARVGAFMLYAWMKQPELWPAPSWHEERARAAVIAGYGFSSGSDALLDAHAVHSSARPTDLWRQYRGEWSACSVGEDRVSAVSSSIGSEHVYVASTPQLAAVSNRARVLWELLKGFGERPVADLDTLASLLSVGFPVCTRASSVCGIHLLAANQAVRIGRSGDCELDEMGWPQLAPSASPPDWNRLAEAVSGNVRWLEHASAPCIAGLTGGKDSRLVLAALAHNRLLEKVRFYISAPADHADSLVAARLAQTLGLRFERTEVPAKHRFLEDIRAHVAFTEGALNAWDLKAGDDYSSQIGIHGLFGELYRGRGAVPSSADPRVASRKLFGTLDVAGILEPNVRRGEYRRTREWLEGLGVAAADPTRLRDLFYLLQRIPRWMGQAKLRDGLSGLHLNPLYHPDLLRSFMRLPPEDRVGERVHFELMLRLRPDLVVEPFAADRWASEMVRRSSAPNTAVAEDAVQHGRPMLGTGWQVPTLVQHWRVIRERILDGMPHLRGVVRPRRAGAMLDVASIVLGASDSRLLRVRTALRHPRMLRRARAKPAAVVQQILGLLTILQLRDELASDQPSLVKVQ